MPATLKILKKRTIVLNIEKFHDSKAAFRARHFTYVIVVECSTSLNTKCNKHNVVDIM